jgi:hypothetical protein
MTGVVHRGGRVIAGANEREFVGQPGVQWKQFRNLESVAGGSDGSERATDFTGRVRLHVEKIELAGGAEVEDENASLVAGVAFGRGRRLHGRELREGKAKCSQRAHLKEIAACNAVASSDGAFARDGQHSAILKRLSASVTMAVAQF